MDDLHKLKTYLKGLRADLARTNKIRKDMATHLKEKPTEGTKPLLEHMAEWKTIQRRMDDWTKKALGHCVGVEKEVYILQQRQSTENGEVKEKDEEIKEKEDEKEITVEVKNEEKIVDVENKEPEKPEKEEPKKKDEDEIEKKKKKKQKAEDAVDKLFHPEKEDKEIDNAVTTSLGQPWQNFAEKINLDHQEVAMEVEIEAPPAAKRAAWDFSPLDPDEWSFTSGEFICVYCGQDQEKEAKMREHFKNAPSACCALLDANQNENQSEKENTLNCAHCTSTFNTESELSSHVVNKHQIKCKYCVETFPSRGYMNPHLKKSHPIEYAKKLERKKVQS